MSDLRAAAQMALEALLANQARWSEKDAAIDALRAALAEPERKPEPTEMPSNTRYTVEIEGHGRTYWDNIHDAITNAQRAVYASVDATTRAVDDLRTGRIAEWSYGFSAVRIYPPSNHIRDTTKMVSREQAWGPDGLMAMAAVRYSLGRSSYIVGDCVNWLIANWALFGERTRGTIQRDVEKAFAADDASRERGDSYHALGMDMDRSDWGRVRALWMEAADGTR